jgi:DNA-binding NarL/FixJ family response regulator
MRVVIAEDQVLLREGLGRLFADAGHEVAASRGDARDLVATVAGHRPDLVVLDIRMPPTFTDEGARAAYEIKRSHPQVGVLVLSQHIETSHAIDLVTLGGFGDLLKDRVLAVDEFLDAAQRVARGGSALDPQVVGRLLGQDRQAGALAELSDREREVLGLMAEGLTNAGIAQRLVVSERTVETHVRNVLTKLNIPDSQNGHRRVLAVLAYVNEMHKASNRQRRSELDRSTASGAVEGVASPSSPPENPAAGCRSGRLEIRSRSPERPESVRPDGSAFVEEPSGPWTAERSLLTRCRSASRAPGATSLPPNRLLRADFPTSAHAEPGSVQLLARGRSHVAEAAFSMIAATAAGCET